MSATTPAPRSRLHDLATLASSLLIAFPLLILVVQIVAGIAISAVAFDKLNQRG